MGGLHGKCNAGLIHGEQRQAIDETKAVFAPLREKVLAAVANLEQLLVCGALYSFNVLVWGVQGFWITNEGLAEIKGIRAV